MPFFPFSMTQGIKQHYRAFILYFLALDLAELWKPVYVWGRETHSVLCREKIKATSVPWTEAKRGWTRRMSCLLCKKGSCRFQASQEQSHLSNSTCSFGASALPYSTDHEFHRRDADLPSFLVLVSAALCAEANALICLQSCHKFGW